MKQSYQAYMHYESGLVRLPLADTPTTRGLEYAKGIARSYAKKVNAVGYRITTASGKIVYDVATMEGTTP